MTIVRIVADDLTGALDAAAPFVATTGPLPVFLEMPSHRTPGGSLVLDSETRDASRPRSDWIDGFKGADLAFKKIDSLLRGRTVDEIAACLASGRFESALIAPAFPAQQRITRGGRQYWRAGAGAAWQPVERDLMAELRRRGVPIRHASSGDAVAGRGFYLCDATTEAELQAIVGAGRRLPGPLLWIGTAGLARALAGSTAPIAATTLAAPLLLVIGSHHPVTLAQIERLAAQAPEAIATIDLDGTEVTAAIGVVAAALDAGRRAGLVLALPDGTGAEVAGPLFDRVMRLATMRLPMPGSLVVSGGATLFRLARALGAGSPSVTGEPMPGVARSRLEGGRWPGATVISKSGAFGTPDLLVRWWNLVQP
ncbi:MAG: four-carbon acid sugar kinase family protein [Geminicoccaceae bacterium]